LYVFFNIWASTGYVLLCIVCVREKERMEIGIWKFLIELNFILISSVYCLIVSSFKINLQIQFQEAYNSTGKGFSYLVRVTYRSAWKLNYNFIVYLPSVETEKFIMEGTSQQWPVLGSITRKGRTHQRSLSMRNFHPLSNIS
jgi:hypothetical protein